MAGVNDNADIVLIVNDDDDEVLQVTVELSRYIGYKPVTARNGYDALLAR